MIVKFPPTLNHAWFTAAKNYGFKNSCYTCLLFSTCFVRLIYYVNILTSVSKICKVSLCAVYSLIERMCSIYTAIIPIWRGNCILIYCALAYFVIYRILIPSFLRARSLYGVVDHTRIPYVNGILWSLINIIVDYPRGILFGTQLYK